MANQRSHREELQASSADKEALQGFRIAPGLRATLTCILGFSSLSHFLQAIGLWDNQGFKNDFDSVIATILIIAPLVGILILWLIYDAVRRH